MIFSIISPERSLLSHSLTILNIAVLLGNIYFFKYYKAPVVIQLYSSNDLNILTNHELTLCHPELDELLYPEIENTSIQNDVQSEGSITTLNTAPTTPLSQDNQSTSSSESSSYDKMDILTNSKSKKTNLLKSWFGQ